MTSLEFTCRDGSPFPVEFCARGDAELRWVIDREHVPQAMTPLADAVRRQGGAGAGRAYAESGLEMWSTLRRETPRAHGYDYYLEDLPPRTEWDTFVAGLVELADAHGGTLGVWLHHSLPRVRAACARLDAAAPDAPFRWLADEREYAWAHTSVAGVVARLDLNALTAVVTPVVGDARATLVAHALAQGSEHDTLAADAALAHLAALDPSSAAEADARRRYLTAYGGRATSWSIDHPTLVEQPHLLDAQLRLVRAQRHRDYDRVIAEALARRRAVADAIESHLDDDAARARFARRLARLESFVPVREARARWQLVASGAMRRAVLQRGHALVDAGVLSQVDDVFFLTPDEYDDPPAGVATAIADRRADHAHWSSVTPPTVIGDTSTATPSGSDGELVGAAGAPGAIKGTARVILDLTDCERLGAGDILVTTMTAPPWTPLLGVAAGVVTDAGDAVSHVAIAARDYGIPCVVGTHFATAVITDGETITVDGDAGVVRLER